MLDHTQNDEERTFMTNTTKLINKKTQKIIKVSEKHAELILASGADKWAKLDLDTAPVGELQDQVGKLTKELARAKGTITKLNKQIKVMQAVTQNDEVKNEEVNEPQTEEINDNKPNGKNKKKDKKNQGKSDNDELDDLVDELD